MFLIREVVFSGVGFIANGLFHSLTTLVVATWILKARAVTWNDLGLNRAQSFKKTLLVTGFILVCTPLSIMLFELVKDLLPIVLAPDTSEQSSVSKFGDLKGNWLLFFSILPFIWLESLLEELLDRGFLLNWFERLFSKTSMATILAVIFQAMIFGFRHSYDLSDRSITVGLIGLVMGIAYVAFGRKLWPLILAHCILNTMSMLERVL
jgi:membrane protease YdiL (CAAX protease family)